MRTGIVALALAMAVWGTAAAALEVSTQSNVGGHFEYGGYTVVPVTDIIPISYPEDPGPAQLFEVIRPDNKAFTLGRLFTSCTCIRMEMPKKSYAAGERCIITVRNVLPSNGQIYPFYVQVIYPMNVTLRYDIYVLSNQFASPAAETDAYVTQDAGSVFPEPAVVLPVENYN